jgi:hypothetical protein
MSTEDCQITVRPLLPNGVALPEIDEKASYDQAILAPSITHGIEPQEATVLAVCPTLSTWQIAGRGTIPSRGAILNPYPINP